MVSISAANPFGLDPVLSRMSSADMAMARAKAGLAAQNSAEKNSTLSPEKLKAIDAASKDFEAVFLSEMLGHMFSSIQADPEFGGGDAENTWKGMMTEQYAKRIVDSGGIGLSKDIKAKMIEIQEGAQNQ